MLIEVNRLFLVYVGILNLCLDSHRVTTLFSKLSLEVHVSGGRFKVIRKAVEYALLVSGF